MRTRSAWFMSFVIIAVMLAYGLMIFRRVPDMMPVHWDAGGRVDRYGSKYEAIFLVPGISFALTCLMWFLSQRIPSLRSGNNLAVFGSVTVLINCFMALVYGVTLQIGLGGKVDILLVLAMAMLLLFAGLMYLMKDTRPNPVMGIRTKWTMQSDRVWVKTHRHAAALNIGIAFAGMFALLVAHISPLVVMAISFFGMLEPVFYSYRISKVL
ncbi:MAG: DUF1648 domain-containing protein [Armatimonadetes bacterium]|nr:DUF1648 domain-containing protein [Armatimonadota bacterium]